VFLRRRKSYIRISISPIHKQRPLPDKGYMSTPRWPSDDRQSPSSGVEVEGTHPNDRPVVIDIERMAAALASETVMIPSGIGREELRAFLLIAARSSQ
jgi:hypothetical protein